MKKQDPAFLFYSKDWLEGTADLMPDEKGVYIDLLAYQHQRGYLPSCTRRLARLVGLGNEEFLKIWEVVSEKFHQLDDRLVNQRLALEMEERAKKSLKNTISGTFAGMLRLGGFDKKTYNTLKTRFKVEDFEHFDKSEITERLTEWLHGCLKSIEDGSKYIEDNSYIEDIKKDKYYKQKEFYKEELEKSNNDPNYQYLINFIFENKRLDGEPLDKVLRVEKQISYSNFKSLYAKARELDVKLVDVLMEFENSGDPKKYKLLSQTLHNWMKNRANGFNKRR